MPTSDYQSFREGDPLYKSNTNNGNNNNNDGTDTPGTGSPSSSYHELGDKSTTCNDRGFRRLSQGQKRSESFVHVLVDKVVGVEEAAVEKVHLLEVEIIDQVDELKQVGKSNLEQAAESEVCTLDMAVPNTLSIVPNDVAQIAAIVKRQQEREQPEGPSIALAETLTEIPLRLEGQDASFDNLLPETQLVAVAATTGIPLVAFVTLGITIAGNSAIGPILDFQTGCSPFMKIVWRQNLTWLLLLPLVLFDFVLRRKHHHHSPQQQHQEQEQQEDGESAVKEHLTCAQWTSFGMTVAAYAAANICFVQALEYTQVGNVVIFANSQAILLLIGKLFMGHKILLLEGAGAIVAFSGAILCSSDSAQASTTTGNNTLLGDLLALGAGISGVSYLIFAQASRKHFNLVPFVFWIMVGGTIFICIFQIVVIREPVTFDRHPTHGFWGFLDNSRFDRLQLELISVVLCNFGGVFGLVLSMQYFSSLVIAVAGLLQPIVAEFMSFFIGVGMLPGILGWIGNILVAVGTLAVVYPSKSQIHEEKNDGRKEEEVPISAKV